MGVADVWDAVGCRAGPAQSHQSRQAEPPDEDSHEVRVECEFFFLTPDGQRCRHTDRQQPLRTAILMRRYDVIGEISEAMVAWVEAYKATTRAHGQLK